MSTEAIQLIAQATQVVAPIGQGFADRASAGYNADIYRKQAGQAVDAAAYQESLARREGRSVIAQQEANALAEGGAGSSQIDVIRQNEVNLIANALAIRHRGATEAAGYESRAAMAEYEGDQALYGGVQAAGSQLLMTAAKRRQIEREAEQGTARRRAKVGV